MFPHTYCLGFSFDLFELVMCATVQLELVLFASLSAFDLFHITGLELKSISF